MLYLWQYSPVGLIALYISGLTRNLFDSCFIYMWDICMFYFLAYIYNLFIHYLLFV